MQELNNVIAAYECFAVDAYITDKCQNCPFNYQYFDDSGDGPGMWRCNEEKLENDMYQWLKIYQHLVEDKNK